VVSTPITEKAVEGLIDTTKIPSELWSAIRDRVLSGVVDAVSDALSGIAGVIGGLAWSIMRTIINVMVDVSSEFFNLLIGKVSEAVPKITGAMSSLVSGIIENVGGLSDAIERGFMSTFNWSAEEVGKIVKDVARMAVPWLPVGERRFADASAKSLVTYWLLSRLEKVASGERGILGTLFGFMTFPFYVWVANLALNIASDVIHGVSDAPPVQLVTPPSEPPVTRYESVLPPIPDMSLKALATRANKYVGVVQAGTAGVLGGWMS